MIRDQWPVTRGPKQRDFRQSEGGFQRPDESMQHGSYMISEFHKARQGSFWQNHKIRRENQQVFKLFVRPLRHIEKMTKILARSPGRSLNNISSNGDRRPTHLTGQPVE